MGAFLQSVLVDSGRNAARKVARLSGVAGAGAILVLGVMAAPASAVNSCFSRATACLHGQLEDGNLWYVEHGRQLVDRCRARRRPTTSA